MTMRVGPAPVGELRWTNTPQLSIINLYRMSLLCRAGEGAEVHPQGGERRQQCLRLRLLPVAPYNWARSDGQQKATALPNGMS